MYHIPTAYLIIGLLYLFLPIVVWVTLRYQESYTAKLWCVGGGLLAIGLLLIAVRASIPAVISYPVANSLCWIGILMQAMSLRHALDRTWRTDYLAVLVLVWVLVFEYFRVVMQSAELRFAWATAFFVMVFCYIAYLAWQVSIAHTLRSGRWLGLVYLLAATTLALRMARVLLNISEPDAVAQGLDSVLTVISGLLISVIGSFAFVSMFLERAAKKELVATELRVREEESRRLGEKIAQLERQRTLGVMSYSFAHELSQPLTAILMDTHSIRSGLSAQPIDLKQITDSLDDVERSANLTVMLIDRIRSFIRPTKNTYDLVDMKTLVRDVKLLLAYDIRTLNITFVWDFDEEPCAVHGDKIQLSQIVLNVYRNAIQSMATVNAQKIFVSLGNEGSRVVLRVRDSGPGLDESLKDKFGQPFLTTKSDGLGVGLSISKTIAEIHGGSLSISNAVNGGALVELNLPAFNP
jgi:C4-dicarboxylate-specific signal transduction histidine kinase